MKRNATTLSLLLVFLILIAFHLNSRASIQETYSYPPAIPTVTPDPVYLPLVFKFYWPLSSALHVLPPVGGDPGDPTLSDRSLSAYLSVNICKPGAGDGRAELLQRGFCGMETWGFDTAAGALRLVEDCSPGWADIPGWSWPQYYETIQTGDVDGDGQAELLGRAGDGMETWHFAAAGAWQLVQAHSPGWTDTAGWSSPQYYSTIQTGDVDGDGKAELLARAAHGMDTYRFTAGTWQLVAVASPPWDDASGWALPQYYSTIQTGDVDGDGQAELLARSSCGMETWHFDAKFDTWEHVRGCSPAWDDTSGWALPQYYSTIQTGDVDGDGKAELLARAAHGMDTYRFTAGTWQLVTVASPPWNDANSWSAHRFYRTIQTGDIDGDGQAELLARAVCGMETWDFDAKFDTWQLVKSCSPQWSDAEGWNEPKYYSTIQTGDINGDGKAELLGRGIEGIEAYRFDGTRGAWVSVFSCDKDTPCPFNATWRFPCPAYSLTIQTADVEGCRPTAAFTSDTIKLRDSVYGVDWQIAPTDVGSTFDIRFAVAGLEVGAVRYRPETAGAVPIRFRIDNHPRIRGRVLMEQGYSAMQVAQVLRDEFNWDAAGTAQILFEEGTEAVLVGEALRDVFSVVEAQQAASILRGAGFSGVDTSQMLKQVFGLGAEATSEALRLAGFSSVEDHYLALTRTFNMTDVFTVEQILEHVGFAPDKFLELTARPSVEKFAPVLGFDGSFNGLPMSAEAYFQNMLHPRIEGYNIAWEADRYPAAIGCRVPLCSREECQNGLANADLELLQHGQVPTYYRVIRDAEGRLRIAYWWFYGWQPYCNVWNQGDDGSHHGDWENILVTTSKDRTIPEAVTYLFHDAWYTRRLGSFFTDTLTYRPLVYVGKLGHGNYHNRDCSGWMDGTPSHCCVYADFRNPTAYTWWNTQQNLVSLAGNSESWMLADRLGSQYEFGGHTYTITAWQWGPLTTYCKRWLFGCMDWAHNSGSNTHPTVYSLDWDLGSCGRDGCGTLYCNGLRYACNPEYNQPWPWD